ncbi:XTP/dITP diphosphatase [Candidatus Micrarchaeota archaeon]|nr:XTP/dITP diphosphatase [Candidatus Micrarchaeota archaeon]
MEILFATSNKHKFSEASAILSTKIKHFPFQYLEIRSDNLEEIARDAVAVAYAKCKTPVFVEDTGLFITALKGFPGTYSAWTFAKIGVEGILKLMKDESNKEAKFETCIAYHDGTDIHVFHDVCEGRLADQKQGNSGFGYDPIFIPEGHTQTFAENITLKNKLSHRYKTLLKFSRFLKTRI